jgi:hypothetical protein
VSGTCGVHADEEDPLGVHEVQELGVLHPGGAAAQAQPQVETQLVLRNKNRERVTKSVFISKTGNESGPTSESWRSAGQSKKEKSWEKRRKSRKKSQRKRRRRSQLKSQQKIRRRSHRRRRNHRRRRRNHRRSRSHRRREPQEEDEEEKKPEEEDELLCEEPESSKERHTLHVMEHLLALSCSRTSVGFRGLPGYPKKYTSGKRWPMEG